MAATPEQEFNGPYVGRSPDSFADAARNAEQNLYDRHGAYPKPDITFRADCYVTIGNPIHEFIVQLTPNP